jgi:hypothetical protein
MSNWTELLNRIIIFRYKRYFKKHQIASKNIERTQNQKLLSYLHRNMHTTFGRDHSFSSIKNYQNFINKVPITEYDDYLPYLQRIKNGNKRVLTYEDPICIEYTSGSSGASKFIPYTQSFLKEFEIGIGVWIYFLFKSEPKTFKGKQYWVVTPPLRKNEEFGNVQLGMKDDTEYLSKVGKMILMKTMSITKSTDTFLDSEDFFKKTLIGLLNDENLSFISAWSPSFLLQIDAFLSENFDNVVKEIPNSIRKAELKKIGKNKTWKAYWKNLEVVSCWTDASSSIWKKSIKRILGESVKIQPKGLLATEGITTIPIDLKGTHVLSLLSHFYEFKLLNGSVVRAHELKTDDIATVILTTSAGLYRYNTHDLISVNRIKDGICKLTFIGRDNKTCDLVGEKLNENHIIELSELIISSVENEIICFCVEGVKKERSAHYLLHLVTTNSLNEDQINQIKAISENLLRKNIYYDQAIKTGQLSPFQVKIEKNGYNQKLLNNYSNYHNIKKGDAKLPLLFGLGELNKINHGN